MIDEPDDLHPILTPQGGEPRPVLRDAILLRTERVLWRRRMASRLTKAGVIAAVFALGMGLGGQTQVKPHPEPNLLLPHHDLVVPVVILVPVPAEPPSSAGPLVRGEPETAAQAELLAEQADDRAESARLYRLAGDRFLNDAQDYRNAARCYRLYAARAGEAALQPAADDSWLLTSIKNALFKEKFHVAKTDG